MFVDNQGMTVEQAIATNLQNLQTIINKLQTDNYGIPIFLCTIFSNWGDANGVVDGVNANIRNLCKTMSGVYCIDFNKYSDFTVNSGWTYTHPVAIGYREMARQIASCIGWTINNNRADFKWIQFVGTEYAVAIGS
jgi:lysophospholipase L1-like esterase